MIGIVIFDENARTAEEMKAYIDGFFKNLETDYYIDIFISRSDLLQIIVRKGGYDVIFLKIGSSEGIDTGSIKSIWKYEKRPSLVLVSDSLEYAVEGYKMEALRYILKSSSTFEKDMDECMGAILDKLQIDLSYKEFNFLEGRKYIPVNNVIYIESNLHKVVFYIWENGIKKYTKYGGINEVTEELFAYGFVRIHKSFSVNMFHITELCRYHVSLRMDITLSVSKNRYKDIEERYLMYKSKKCL